MLELCLRPTWPQTNWKTNQADERTVRYTPFDLPRTVTSARPTPHTVTYAYDADQTRFRQSDNTNTTTYVDNLYERRVDATGATKHIFYIYAEGRRIAQVVRVGSTDTLTRLYSDALGSVTAAGQGGIRQGFTPWGERIAFSPSAPPAPIPDVTTGFTDQEQDDGVGLINMRGRVYDPTTATFLTPDPIVGKLNVAGWNKYAYVLNNPLKYVDPLGFDAENGRPDSNGTIDAIQGGAEPIQITETLVVTPSWASLSPGESFNAGVSDNNGYIPPSSTTGPSNAHSTPSTSTFAGLTGPLTPLPGPPPNWRDDGNLQHRGLAMISGDAPEVRGPLLMRQPYLDAADAAIRLSGHVAIATATVVIPELLAAAPEIALAAEGEGLLGGLADGALVCRGGTCTAERFINGSGVTSDAAGRLSGVSVNAGTAPLQELTAALRYRQVGVSTAGEVRAAGGVLTHAPSPFNPYHHELSGLTGEQLEQLFTPTIRNPNF